MPVKFRVSQWLDTSLNPVRPLYGIHANCGSGWRNLAIDGKPAFFASKAAAKAKIEELLSTQEIEMTKIPVSPSS